MAAVAAAPAGPSDGTLTIQQHIWSYGGRNLSELCSMHTLSSAARAVGVARFRIWRAVKAGGLSAHKSRVLLPVSYHLIPALVKSGASVDVLALAFLIMGIAARELLALIF